MLEIASRSKPAVGPETTPAPKPQPDSPRGATATPARTVDSPAAPRRKSVVVGKRAEPIRAGAGLLSVIGADERQRIRDTELSPFRMICALKIEAPWGEFVGTGWFAGPRTLVTAGHCVFDSASMGGWADKIHVTPGRDGAEPPAFGVFKATRFSALNRWVDDRDPDFDIGCIHLDEPAGEATGWFGVAALPDAELADSMVNVSGYPASPGGGTEQWWARNRIRAVTPRRIFYDVDTSGGQSGGPVFRYADARSDPLVVGIHAYGVGGTPDEIKLEVNSAPRMLPEVVQQIRQWVDADAPAPAA